VSSLAPDDFAWLSATEQLAALDAGEVSSAELVELYLSRISTHNPSLNAVVTVDADAARRAATEADAARSRGDLLGPLHGLPITVKDSYETAGMRTVCGRLDLADHVPTQDAEAVARLRRSGAIIVGKTNMPTGNADVQASNPVFGRTNNPWDRSRTSGGSAGGGAAATAAGLTSFDYGSESVAPREFRLTSVASMDTSRPGSLCHWSATSPVGRGALDDGAKPTWPVLAYRCVVPATSSRRWQPPSVR
jgi:amidase